ncbi:hypothetical protein E2C01_044882 [Portunus trituberculatus]|uniref:Uncharacterized protein n=1 Tax=Portunus trituberculatus TaxID=210409 RepID=A0A5B7G0C6_PORTR|nr:hypothetical protein [Portunus trituberculatus]
MACELTVPEQGKSSRATCTPRGSDRKSSELILTDLRVGLKLHHTRHTPGKRGHIPYLSTTTKKKKKVGEHELHIS